jgi:bis(5'-nucleosyl)-tetraphosphatase (symmetrical)
MDYLVGDIQGCCDAFDALLEAIAFSPSRDRLFVLGDLVNRGPKSLATLQRLIGLGASAVCLLGNHDLHLLAVERGVRPVHRNDTLQDILDSPQRGEWIDWVRARPLAIQEQGWLMVHAGVVPQWDAPQALALAQEVSAMLRGPELHDFLTVMYGNDPLRWSDTLSGPDRWRFVINTLTRIRFCGADGTLEFGTKGGPPAAPPGMHPWFDVPGRCTAGTPIAFGHWSALGLVERPDLLALDTGCVWGGKLTAVRIDSGRRELVQVDCARPGGPHP